MGGTWRLPQLLLLLGLGAMIPKAHSVGEIGSSILVMGPSDYLENGGTSRCEQMVERAAKLKQSRINFTPSLFWVDENGSSRKSVNAAGQVTYWCYTRSFPTMQATCPEATEADRVAFRNAMAKCFNLAVSHGLSIAVTPHVDDGLGLGGWRNGLVFDPLKKYGNYSYAEFMLYPLADALNSVILPTTDVTFALQGEMSATVFYHPESYEKLMPIIKKRILRGKPESMYSNVETGLSTNFDKLCGCVLQDLIDPSEYLKQFPAAFESQRGNFDTRAIARAYDAADFIGISNYASMQPGFQLKELESATFQFAREASYFGVDVKDLIFNKGKKLYWMEYGVGGGRSQAGNVKATSAFEAAATPFFGIFGAYSPENNPWTVPSVRDYMHYFYAQTINYLRSQGTCPGCQFRVDQVYLWNDGSWDVQAIYPESSNEKGSFRDDFAVALIESHNNQAMNKGCACSDVPSSPGTSCVNEVHANMCNQQWYVIGDFCQSSCDRCFCSGACSDSPPDNRYSCEQQAAWGQCQEAFMSGYCRKSCGVCKTSATEVGVDPDVVAARRIAALLAKAGAPSASDLPDEEALEVTLSIPVPMPGPEVSEVSAFGTPGRAPAPVPGPMPDVVPLHLSSSPTPAPAPAPDTPISGEPGSLGSAPVPVPAPEATHSRTPVPSGDEVPRHSSGAPAPVPQGPSSATPVGASAGHLSAEGSPVMAPDQYLPPAASPETGHVGVPGPSPSQGPQQVPPLASVPAEVPSASSQPLQSPTSGPSGSTLPDQETRAPAAAPTSAPGATAPTPAPVPASGPSQGIVLLGPSQPYTGSRKEGAGDDRLGSSAAAPTGSDPANRHGSTEGVGTAALVSEQDDKLGQLKLPTVQSGNPGVQVFLQLDGNAHVRNLKAAAASSNVEGSQNLARRLLSSREGHAESAEGGAPAPHANTYGAAVSPSAAASAASWLDLARSGDLAKATQVATQEYVAMADGIDKAATVRPGRASINNQEEIAQMVQANRLSSAMVLGLQTWRAAEAAYAAARAPSPAPAEKAAGRAPIRSDAPIGFAFTRTNSLGKPTVPPKTITWSQSAVITSEQALKLKAEIQPPLAAPAPLWQPFSIIRKDAGLAPDVAPASEPSMKPNDLQL
eukprot:jgi/Botrbrau1/14446/Bobra.0014s0091.1